MTESTASPAFLRLEIKADDANPASPAEVEAVAEEMRRTLEKAGFEVRPAYMGTRGGEWLDIVFTATVTTLGIVLTVVSITTGILDAILKFRELTGKKGQEAQPQKVELSLGGMVLLDPATLLKIQQQAANQLSEPMKNEIQQIIHDEIQNSLSQYTQQTLSTGPQITGTVLVPQSKRKKRP